MNFKIIDHYRIEIHYINLDTSVLLSKVPLELKDGFFSGYVWGPKTDEYHLHLSSTMVGSVIHRKVFKE